MKRQIVGAWLASTLISLQASAADLTGAGSTFVYPILAKWSDSYKKETGISVNYQSIGSGGGIKQIQNKTVDFGASDMPLKPEVLEQHGLIQFPLVSGAVVPIVNLPLSHLNLSGPILAKIYLGQITKWNASEIQDLNPGVELPDKMISVVHRSDGSGTTFIWTNYLSKVSEDWKTIAGEGSSVSWPVGIGGKGNEGVASYVKHIKGSIGYVEFAFALQNKMTMVSLKNQAGALITPSMDSFTAALASADWKKAPGYYLVVTNAPGKTSWPIAGTTFVLMHKKPANLEHTQEALKFFRWVYQQGESSARLLHFVPIPSSLSEIVQKDWAQHIKVTL